MADDSEHRTRPPQGLRGLWILLLAAPLACATGWIDLSERDRHGLGEEGLELARLAKSGDPEAALDLADRLDELGSDATARRVLRRGAEAGHVPSMTALGRSYLHLLEARTSSVVEDGVARKTHVEACAWLGRGARAGDPRAQLHLASGWPAKGCRRRLQDSGTPASFSRSGDQRREERWREWWLRQAADQELAAAEFALAELLMQPFWQESADVWTHAEKEARIREGSDRLHEIARKGHPDAAYRLGALYMPGTYCRKSPLPPTFACRVLRARMPASRRRSVFWYGKAASLGQPCAHTVMGSLHEQGYGVKANLVDAHRHYEIAALEADPSEGAPPGPERTRTAPELCRDAARAKLQELAQRSDPALVALAQKRLAELGHSVGRVDGKPGARTLTAVRRFQSEQGMYPDGRITFGLVERMRTTGARPQPQTRIAAHSTTGDAAPPAAPAESVRRPLDRRRVLRQIYDRRVAAVIGIDEYRSWPTLEGARRDARRVAEDLRRRGFDEVIEIYDGSATRRRILNLLGSELPEKTGSRSLALIYFAGHGETETLHGGEKRGYLIPADADRKDVFSTAISMDTVRELSNRIPARHVYYAMDSCYSGLGLTRGVARVGAPDYILQIAGQRSVQMITAGGEGERALERGGRGLFTTHFLRALQGEGDLDSDGFVTGSEIGAYVRPQVSRATRSRQTPLFGTLEGSGEVVFLPQSPE